MVDGSDPDMTGLEIDILTLKNQAQDMQMIKMMGLIGGLLGRIKALERALKLTDSSASLSFGDASIRITRNGDIRLAGRDIEIKAVSAIDIKANGDVKIKGQKIVEN